MLKFLIFPFVFLVFLNNYAAELVFTLVLPRFSLNSVSLNPYSFEAKIEYNEEIANYDDSRYIVLKLVNVDNNSQIYLMNNAKSNLTLGVDYKYDETNKRDIILLNKNTTLKFFIENVYPRAYYQQIIQFNAFFYKNQTATEYLKSINISLQTFGFQWSKFFFS